MKLAVAVILLSSSLAAMPSAWAGPGDGLLPGSQFGQGTVQMIPGGDDIVKKAFANATANTTAFLGKMWDQYGPKSSTGTEGAWQFYLRKAIESAKAGDWNQVEQNCEQSIANNQNALDAKLLRAVAFQKLNMQPKAAYDIQTLMTTRQRAQEFLYGKNSQNPVADSVLKQTGQ